MTEHDGSTHSLLLSGLDGGNPLGFLAAIGTLRVATLADKSATWLLGWLECGGIWTPFLACSSVISQNGLTELLMSAMNRNDNQAFKIADNLNMDPKDFRAKAQEACQSATPHDRNYADFVASFGSESVVARDNTIQDTAFRTMSGVGNQHFLKFMRELAKKTKSQHLRTSLFEQWRYSDKRPSLRWDPMDDRRYALRWDKPVSGTVRTMRGANRLAVEALPLFPTAHKGAKLHTTGFLLHRRNTFLTWPIWEAPLNVDVVRSLLSLSQLQSTQPDRSILQSIGVKEVYRSQRITADRYRNFTTSFSVWAHQ